MAKEVKSVLKLQIQAGQANPSPPVGPALGQAGVNIMGFCKEFNAATQGAAGDLLPTVITVYKDASFTFVTKQPPAAVLLKKAAGLASGSGEPNKVKVGKISKAGRGPRSSPREKSGEPCLPLLAPPPCAPRHQRTEAL